MVSPLVVTKAGIIYGAIITGLWLMERVYHTGKKKFSLCNGSLATGAWVDRVAVGLLDAFSPPTGDG